MNAISNVFSALLVQYRRQIADLDAAADQGDIDSLTDASQNTLRQLTETRPRNAFAMADKIQALIDRYSDFGTLPMEHARQLLLDARHLGVSNAIAAVPSATTTGSSHFGRLLSEYHTVHSANEASALPDDDPRLLANYGRLSDIEREFVQAPSRSTEDAKAKLRFVVDLGRLGVVLDGEDAHAVVKDASEHLL